MLCVSLVDTICVVVETVVLHVHLQHVLMLCRQAAQASA